MSKLEITGTIIAEGIKRSGVSATKGTPWATKEYVLETQEEYPKKVCFEVFGEDKINEYNLQVGASVTIGINIDARQFNGKWYNTIRAWRVVHNAVQTQAAPAPQQAYSPTPTPTPAPTPQAAPTQGFDDVPF